MCREFNLNCLLIEFVITNLSQIYYCVPEIFSTKSSSVFSHCELRKVIKQLVWYVHFKAYIYIYSTCYVYLSTRILGIHNKAKNLKTDKFLLKLETFVHKKTINYLTTIWFIKNIFYYCIELKNNYPYIHRVDL